MPSEKTTAIVLRVVDFSESSCVVTLYTEDFGKVSALAKGARRLRSPFDGALDLLSCCRIVFLRKSVDVLDLLTEARLERRFRSASTDLGRLYAGMYVIELVAALTDHGEPQPKLYQSILDTVIAIDSGMPLQETILQFEWRLLAELGHAPSLEECVECGSVVDMADARRGVAFGVISGGIYCDGCRTGKRGVVRLHNDSVDWLRKLSSHSTEIHGSAVASDLSDPAARARAGVLNREEEPDGLPSFHGEVCEETSHFSPAAPLLAQSVRGELRGVFDQYLANLIGHRLRTAELIRQVFRTGDAALPGPSSTKLP